MSRMRLPHVEDFSDRLRGPQVSSRVGSWLGVAFGIAFITGVWSHLQYSPGWLPLPTRPVWLYRVTQGLHVTAGTVAVPLLLVKLWSVYPRLYLRPPRGVRALVIEALERLSIAVLVSAAIFQLTTGLMNAAQWYPWGFGFRETHYAVAWVAIAALLLHIAVKLPLVRRSWSAPLGAAVADAPAEPPAEGRLTRRGLLRTTWVAAGVAALATAGAAVPFLRDVSVFAVRTGDGPQGVPINRSAEAAGVVESARDPGWRLEVVYAGRTTTYSRADLEQMARTTADLPIACVEGWSAGARWSGVPVAELLRAVGAPERSRVLVSSLQEAGSFRSTVLPEQFAADPLTLLALTINGETLDLDHGYPCRLIAPARPGVMQTKWVRRLEVLT